MHDDDGVREALMSDSAATLRQVKGVLSDFESTDEAPASDVERPASDLADAPGAPDDLEDLVRILVGTRSDIAKVVESLRLRSGPSEANGASSEIPSARHALNNYLMSALAEVQLLIMDVESEELRESYEIIQEALRGMRSVVASIAHVRV